MPDDTQQTPVLEIIPPREPQVDATASTSEEHNGAQHAQPGSQRRSVLAVVGLVLVIVALVAATAVVTHWVDSAVQGEPTPGAATVTTPTPDPRLHACQMAARSSQKAARHWAGYMDDVQRLYLATSTSRMADALHDLGASYRAVVHDTVPLDDRLTTCLHGN